MNSAWKIFHGKRKRSISKVTVNGEPLQLRLEMRSHSPTGFAWGYSGSGPAQLSLAILCECTGSSIAHHYYQDFKRELIAAIHDDEWAMTEGDVRDWLKASVLADVVAGGRSDVYFQQAICRFVAYYAKLADEGKCDAPFSAEFWRLLDAYIDDVLPEPIDRWIIAHANYPAPGSPEGGVR